MKVVILNDADAVADGMRHLETELMAPFRQANERRAELRTVRDVQRLIQESTLEVPKRADVIFRRAQVVERPYRLGRRASVAVRYVEEVAPAPLDDPRFQNGIVVEAAMHGGFETLSIQGAFDTKKNVVTQARAQPLQNHRQFVEQA